LAEAAATGLTTNAKTSVTPPRTELAIGDTSALTYNGEGTTLVGGLLRWQNGSLFKLLVGAANKGFLIDQDVVVGPYFPNRNGNGSDSQGPIEVRPQAHTRICGRGQAGKASSATPHGPSTATTGTCLFELTTNPDEDPSQDLAAYEPELFASMLARIDELQGSVFSPERGDIDPMACTQAISVYGGYWGPWL
jgi:hypothetical protein